MTELVNQRFGKYLLLNRIAQGGMAELFQAKLVGDEGFEKLVAIKKILPYLAEETNLVNSFIDEARLAAFLQHPNIAQIYDFGSVNNTYYIAMEYLYGKDLKQIIKQYKEMELPLSIENALYIATQVCAGLDYAHKLKDFRGKPLNITHRDIGPHNIFITYDGQVKIIDFGIAKAAIQHTKTQIGSIKGKIAYMSPEQAHAEKIDHRTDIYAMGILLYEILTHEKMFEGDTASVFNKVREAQYTPPGEVNKSLPPELCMIIEKALKKDREERYQSAEELLAALENCKHELSLIPSYRNLALYMNKLFGEVAETGFKGLKEDTYSGSASGTSEILRSEPVKTLVLEEKDLPLIRKRHLPMFAFISLILIASIFLLLIFIKRPEPLLNGVSQVFNSEDSGNEPASEPVKNITSPENQANPESLKKSSDSGDFSNSVRTDTDTPEMKEGIRLIKQGMFAEASALFGNMLTNESLNDERVSALYCEALVGQASKISEKEPEKAKAMLLKVVKLVPENPRGHYLLGRIYSQQKDFTSAIASYQAAVELDPQMYNAFFNLGYIYAVKKDYVKAREMFTRVVELSPPFLDEALYNLAIVQRKMGNIQDCIKNLERAITVNPENKKAKMLLDTLKK